MGFWSSRAFFRWYQEWDAYTSSEDAPKPEAIINDDLLEDGELRKGLIDLQDYVLVGEAVWNKFQQWYGGGPEIERVMIETGINRRLRVEVYPMTVRVVERRNERGKEGKQQNSKHDLCNVKAELLKISKAATGMELLRLACQRFYSAPHNSLLWRLGVDGYVELELHKVSSFFFFFSFLSVVVVC